MKEFQNIISLNSKKLPKISEVGGKGYSLIKLSSINLNVPPGIVLTVNFFKSWISLIKNTELYKSFLLLLQNTKNSDSKECSSLLNKIKDWCINNLFLSEENKNDIQKILKKIFPKDYSQILFAVRSSSPEEDLAGASFAGNYETYLGIKLDSLEKYILKSFISCLDYRVFKYKIEKGFNVSEIKIAIVIMKQINCDVAGVGFSINPINNDYDEAVITSNFGLGESVVGGIITPDEFIVNKLTYKIISEKLGTKDKIVKLNLNSNETSIIKQNKDKSKEFSLTKELIVEIIKNIVIIENNYKAPIDIEFGIEKNILYILQARFITTYTNIPKQLLTAPNEKRKLYFDATIGVQGIEKPISTLGTSIFKIFAHYMGIKIFGSYNLDNIKDGPVDGFGGKLLMNFSNILTKVDVESLAGFFNNINKLISDNLIKYGENYKDDKVCYEIDFTKIGMIWRLPMKRIIFYNFFSESSKENFEYYMKEYIEKNEKYIKDNMNSDVPILTIFEKLIDELTDNFRDYGIPVIILGMPKGYMTLRNLFEKYIKDNPELTGDLNNLTKCLPFITIKMGLDIYKLSTLLDKTSYKDKTQEQFYEDYINNNLPIEFYTDFKKFMKNYGFRGEGELDIKNERYSDNPKTILNQILSSLTLYDQNNNPVKDYDDTNLKRPEIYKKLQKFAEKNNFSSQFEESYNNTINFFHYREAPKYYIIFIIGHMRKLILKRAEVLLKKNLINDINDIFNFKLKTLDYILQNLNKFTKEKIYEYMKKDNELYEIFNSWKMHPLLFDSRGRFFFQEKKISNKKNELIGETVSFGKIRGKAKVLKYVDEKVFNPGEILITKATDPGWTPLIINCGGIVLEVGGMLQHGALVSREFNKPCVVGIDNATEIIIDGEEIEVDAIEGVVRMLDREE